jgi:hypothetical protein
MVSPAADIIALAYCLIAGTTAYLFRSVRIVFVDAEAENRRMKPGDGPSAEA